MTLGESLKVATCQITMLTKKDLICETVQSLYEKDHDTRCTYILLVSLTRLVALFSTWGASFVSS